MRIPKSSALIKSIPDIVPVNLPDFAKDLHETAGVPGAANLLYSQLTEQGWSLTASNIWQKSSQVALRNIISGIGIPNGPMASQVIDILGAFDPRISTAERLEKIFGSIEDALVQLTQKALGEAIEAGVGAAVDVVSAIPFVGLFVKIAWLFGKTAYKAAHMDPYDDNFPLPPSLYDPITDEQYLNSLLMQLKKNDWSTLFYPPSVGRPASQPWQKPIRVNDLTNGGKRFAGTSPGGIPFKGPDDQQLYERPWIGFVPGTMWLHQAIETTGSHKVIETGQTMLPSSSNQAGWLWRNITRTNSPSAFTIHCNTAEDFWQTYIEDLRQAIRASSFNEQMKNKVFKYFDKRWAKGPLGHGQWSKTFGWGDGSKEIEYAPGPVLRVLRQRQLALCDTLTVAYVDETFGAAKDPTVRAKILQRQKDLLEHPAVCDVDLTNVPDVLLHDEILERRKGYACKVSGTDSIASGGLGPQPPSPPDVPDGFASPDDGDDRRKWPAYVAAGAGIAAVGGLGYYCRRDLQKALRNLRLRIPI